MPTLDDAFLMMQKGAYQEALPILKAVISTDPNNWYALYIAGHCRRGMGDFESAIKNLERASTINPQEPRIWISLGIALQLAESFPNAVKALNTAIELNPIDFESRNSLGLTYKKMEDLDNALRSYEVAANILSDEALKSVKEQGHIKTSVSDEGEKTYTLGPEHISFVGNWLKKDGRYSVVMNNIGGVYLELEEDEKARNAFFESIEMTPPNTSYQPPYEGLKILGIEYSDL